MKPKYPEMIIFDYGQTLIYEPEFNTLAGNRALMKYIKTNKYNLSAEQIDEHSMKLYNELSRVKSMNIELHERQFQRLLYEYLGIVLSIPYEEVEIIFWDSTSPGSPMPGVGKMLADIKRFGIRSAVISNIGYSGAALCERINRLLPDNEFEFIIASSEYAIRKPNPVIFRLAARKANLAEENIWYCGDNISADIAGASAAGMFPVWYDCGDVNYPRDREPDANPQCGHLHIRNWSELEIFLNDIKKS